MKKKQNQIKHLKNQIDLVAKTIMEYCPEEIGCESACEVAARLIKKHYKK